LIYDSFFVTGLQDLIETLQKFAFIPKRLVSSPFLFAVDHCFSVRGQGTVMTGTILQGTVSVNDVRVIW
jgi:selenocysteine-specific elongation factor